MKLSYLPVVGKSVSKLHDTVNSFLSATFMIKPELDLHDLLQNSKFLGQDLCFASKKPNTDYGHFIQK